MILKFIMDLQVLDMKDDYEPLTGDDWPSV